MKKILVSLALTMALATSVFAQTSPTVRVNSLAELVALPIPTAATYFTAIVAGSAAAGDSPLASVFAYVPGSSAATNTFGVFKPTATTGRWIKITTDEWNQFSAATLNNSSTYAMQMYRNMATNVFGIGADNTSAYIQSWASYSLGINPNGNTLNFSTNSALSRFHGIVHIGPYPAGGTVQTVTGLSLANNVFLESANAAGDTARGILGITSGNVMQVGANGATLTEITFLPGVTERMNLSSDGLKVGASGTRIREIYSATANLDFPSINAASLTNLTITVAGAGTNSTVSVSPANGTGMTNVFLGSAWVSATNTVTVSAVNPTVGAFDPASTAVRVTVFQY